MHCRWMFILLSSLILSQNSAMICSAAPQQPAHKESQSSQWIQAMTARLGIPVILVDSASLTGMDAHSMPPMLDIRYQPRPSPGLQNDDSVSRQELLNQFIAVLREYGLSLVKSQSVCQIVSLSKNSEWEPVTKLAEIPEIPKGNSRSRIMMNYIGIPLQEFCSMVSQLLGIIPIAIDPAVRGSVMVYNTEPITKDVVFSLLISVLKNNNAKIIESAGQFQVVPISQNPPSGWKILTGLPAVVNQTR
jgi:hypothetical protein